MMNEVDPMPNIRDCLSMVLIKFPNWWLLNKANILLK